MEGSLNFKKKVVLQIYDKDAETNKISSSGITNLSGMQPLMLHYYSLPCLIRIEDPIIYYEIVSSDSFTQAVYSSKAEMPRKNK